MMTPVSSIRRLVYIWVVPWYIYTYMDIRSIYPWVLQFRLTVAGVAMLGQRGGSCEHTAAQHHHLCRYDEHLWKMRRVLGSSEPLCREGCVHQAAHWCRRQRRDQPRRRRLRLAGGTGCLGSDTCEHHAVDTMACITMYGVPSKTASTNTGIVGKGRV